MKMNLGIKIRAKVVFAEVLLRLIIVVYNIIALFFSLFFIPFMIFSQKHYNYLIDLIRSQWDD